MTYHTMGLIKNVSSTGETTRDVSAGEYSDFCIVKEGDTAYDIFNDEFD